MPPVRPLWRARCRAMLTERLALKATALGIAVLLWIVIGARQPTESYVSVAVMPVMDSTRVLLGDPPIVRALVAGRAADIMKLRTLPPVLRRTIDARMPDTLVLDLAPGDVHVPIEMARDVRVLDLEPRSVTLRFARPSRRAECPASINCGASPQ
jgi:hypothetical protein